MTRLLAMVWPALRDPAADITQFASMLDALDDLSPRVEAVDAGVALIDVTGLGALHGTERRIAAKAVTLARGVATVPVRCGIGDNRWLAVLAARLARPAEEGAPAALRVLECDELTDLPINLLPADSKTHQRFGLFGLTTLGQLAQLPRSAVGAQFGPAGERLQALARGEDPRPLVPRRRPERMARRLTFEPPVEGVGSTALALRRACAELCDRLRTRHLAPGRATLRLSLEDARPMTVTLAFPEPALEPDWMARLLIGRLEAVARAQLAADHDEPRVTSITLILDRLTDPATRQMPAFEAQAGRWEELRWQLERLRARFGEDRLWRATLDRPRAALAEHRSRLVDIGP